MSTTVSTRKRIVLRLTDEQRDALYDAINAFGRECSRTARAAFSDPDYRRVEEDRNAAHQAVLDCLYPSAARVRARAQAKAAQVAVEVA